MTNLLLRIAISAGAVLLAVWLSETYRLDLFRIERPDSTLVSAIVLAIVLGLMNALIRPFLLLVTCPVNLVTLGLFTFVVNALVFWMASGVTGWFVPGIQVTGFVGALVGSLVVSACSAIANRYLE